MINKFNSITDIISGNRMLEAVVERLGIEKNYYHQELDSACQKNGTDADFVVEVIKAFSENVPFPAQELSTFPLALILDYLRKTHSYYLEKKIPEIEQSFIHLSTNFSESHSHLLHLATIFMEYKKELVEHIDNEEFVLFPYIDELLKANSRGKNYKSIGLDRYSLHLFHDEHHHDEEILTEIRRSIEYQFRNKTLPLPFQVFTNQIEVLEKDLLRHSLIEDEVLLPKALLLEQEVKKHG